MSKQDHHSARSPHHFFVLDVYSFKTTDYIAPFIYALLWFNTVGIEVQDLWSDAIIDIRFLKNV